MRTTVLDGLYGEVILKHAAWPTNEILARHLTLTIDGWSNARMESIYSFNIIFPNRRVILLKSEDLSTTTHSGHNIAGVLNVHSLSIVFCNHIQYIQKLTAHAFAGLVIAVMEQYGPRRFVGLVIDNARNTVNMCREVLERFPHLIECSSSLLLVVCTPLLHSWLIG